MPTTPAVRWGLLGTGSINERFLAHVREAPNVEIVAVGSRTAQRAAAFAAQYGIERAHASYESLLADPHVEAVYINVPNGLHHGWTMRAIQAGKHVLCEKPYSRRPVEVIEAFDAADRAGLTLMEGFMWRHARKARRFMELLPEIGPLQAIRVTHAFRLEGTTDIRLDPELDGGSLMDVGCYCVNALRLVAGLEPERVVGEQVVGPSGVDIQFSGILRFSDGLLGSFVAGFTFQHATLEAIGRGGSLFLPDPFNNRPAMIRLNDREIHVETPDPYRLEMENMSAAIRGQAEPLLGREDALGQARAIEALYRSADSGSAKALVQGIV